MHRDLLRELHPGLSISMVDAVRDLLERGLAIVDSDGDGRAIALLQDRYTNKPARL